MTDKKSAVRHARKSAARPYAAAAPTAKKSAAPTAEKTTAAASQTKRVASTPAKKATPPARATKAAPVPAAPLLARSPKKTGEVAAQKRAETPKADAPYQPKTEPPPPGHNSRKAMPIAVPTGFPGFVNPLAIAAPWMRLGLHMTMAGFAMQVRMARAIFPRTPTASPTGAAAAASPVEGSAARSSSATEK